MIYVNPQGEYPFYKIDLQTENPDWKDGDPLPEGWLEIEFPPKPIEVVGKVLVYSETLDWIDGKPVQNWIYLDPPTKEPEVIE